MKQLSTMFWLATISGIIAGWLAIAFAIVEGSGDLEGALALAAAGLAFGLVSIAIARVLSR